MGDLLPSSRGDMSIAQGSAPYQRTPMSTIAGGSWAPLQLTVIVSLPLCVSSVTGRDHTTMRLKCKWATELVARATFSRVGVETSIKSHAVTVALRRGYAVSWMLGMVDGGRELFVHRFRGMVDLT